MRVSAAVLVMMTAGSCTPVVPVARTAPDVGVMLQEPFTTNAFDTRWAVIAPNEPGAIARVDHDELALRLPADAHDEIRARRKLDALRVRGQRVRLTVSVRTEGVAGSAARAMLTAITTSAAPSYRDLATTSTSNATGWTTIHTVIDVAANATSLQLDLVWKGAGTAWFSEVEIRALGDSPRPAVLALSSQQLAHLAELTRSAAFVRYAHPSDEAAALDWNAFWPAAIDRVLRVPDQASLVGELRELWKDIAPTVTFTTGRGEPGARPPRGNECDHLVRWRRHGLGNMPPYTAYREGRDADPSTASLSLRLALATGKTCKKLALHARGHKLAGAGKAELFATVLEPATRQHDHAQPLDDAGDRDADRELALAVDVPGDAQDVEVGLRVTGRSGATLTALTAACDGGAPRPIDLAPAPSRWRFLDDTDLFTWAVGKRAGAPCAKLEHKPAADDIDPADLLDVDLGGGITMHVPLAVWADAHHTWPVVAAPPALADFTIDDLPTRLAAVASAWATTWMFYPYFADQQIDWTAVLPDALAEAAAAGNPQDTHAALAHMLSHLRDNHIKITHPGAALSGILPLMFRKLDERIVVNGGLPAYLDATPIGSELISLDGVSAAQAYERAGRQISAATDGLYDYLTPARMVMGPTGTFHRLQLRGRDGALTEHLVPLVSVEQYHHANREPRPASGSELAPGILYLDLDELPLATWQQLEPAFEPARAVILDLRGYVTPTTLEVLSHLTSHDLHSPIWQIPILPATAADRETPYLNAGWDVRPQAPRLAAKVVILIDGRAMSAVETVLHMIHEAHLGVLVGEPSGGTNGNVDTTDTPGGFSFRFTAMRVASPDGSLVQGHGFQPDEVIHPTLAGIQAGRDEILEAGLATARRLITTP